MIPQNQNEQVLAIPIKDQSEPVEFSMDQMHVCKQVKFLFLCYLSKLNIQPTQESCLIAFANKQYLDTVHLCQLTISCPQEILYQTECHLSLKEHQIRVGRSFENRSF